MIIHIKNDGQVYIRRLTAEDFDSLFDYLQQLSPETKKRFGPHALDQEAILDLYKFPDQYLGYIALDTGTLEIIAYSIIKIGYLEHDLKRLQSYGLTPDPLTDCTFAPSVADQWQQLGIGNGMLSLILSDLKAKEIKRIILWGGVQCDNLQAVNYYRRHGFRTLGQFEYNGLNWDMILDLTQPSP
jgi:diamine N-acetyltransferase